VPYYSLIEVENTDEDISTLGDPVNATGGGINMFGTIVDKDGSLDGRR